MLYVSLLLTSTYYFDCVILQNRVLFGLRSKVIDMIRILGNTGQKIGQGRPPNEIYYQAVYQVEDYMRC